MTITTVEIRKLSIQKRLSRETLCFSCDLVVNGKKVGEAYNEGHGGCNGYNIADHATEMALYEWAKLQVPAVKFEQLDHVIDKLIQNEEDKKEDAKFLKALQTKTYLRFKGDEPGTWRIVKSPFTEECKAAIVAKYGDKIEMFANDDPQKALALDKAGAEAKKQKWKDDFDKMLAKYRK